MSRVSTRPGGSSLRLSLRIDRRRDIPRKIVRVLRESRSLADETLRRAISPSFHLNRGRERLRSCASASSHRVSSLLFPPFAGTASALRNLVVFASRIALSDLGYRVPFPFHELLRRHQSLLSRKIHLMLFNSIV